MRGKGTDYSAWLCLPAVAGAAGAIGADAGAGRAVGADAGPAGAVGADAGATAALLLWSVHLSAALLIECMFRLCCCLRVQYEYSRGPSTAPTEPIEYCRLPVTVPVKSVGSDGNNQYRSVSRRGSAGRCCIIGTPGWHVPAL